MIRLFSLAMLALLLSPFSDAKAAEGLSSEGGFHDGDVIYFFGDSNTEWGSAPTVFRNWVKMRYPKKNIQVLNAGVAGDNALAAYHVRVESDLFPKERAFAPTRVFVLFGINDIDWGRPTGEKRKLLENAYVEGVTRITQAVKDKSPKTQVYILSYPPVTTPDAESLRKEPGLISLENLNSTPDGKLNVLCNRGAEAAKKCGAEFLGINQLMRKSMGALRENGVPKYNWKKDGVHLTAEGAEHEVAALLEALREPRVVSSVTVDAAGFKREGAVTDTQGATLSHVTYDLARKRISFDRDDEGLPYVQGFSVSGKKPLFDYSQSPMGKFTRYLLAVTDLPAGRYSVSVGGSDKRPGRVITSESGLSAAQLAQGVDLTYFGHDDYSPKTPWAVKSRLLSLYPGDRADQARMNTRYYNNEDPAHDEILKKIETLRLLEHDTTRALSQPYPIHFTIERMGD